MGHETETPASSGSWLLVAISWAAVSLPLAWGIWMTAKKALLLFS